MLHHSLTTPTRNRHGGNEAEDIRAHLHRVQQLAIQQLQRAPAQTLEGVIAQLDGEQPRQVYASSTTRASHRQNWWCRRSG